ncbi:MAG: hypothetical protein ACR2I2_11145 [Bryobacteraceae bacterium]
MQYGLLLSGAQQGYIKGGLNYRAVLGVGLEDSSNGVEISGVSFDDLDAAARVARKRFDLSGVRTYIRAE